MLAREWQSDNDLQRSNGGGLAIADRPERSATRCNFETNPNSRACLFWAVAFDERRASPSAQVDAGVTHSAANSKCEKCIDRFDVVVVSELNRIDPIGATGRTIVRVRPQSATPRCKTEKRQQQFAILLMFSPTIIMIAVMRIIMTGDRSIDRLAFIRARVVPLRPSRDALSNGPMIQKRSMIE